MGLAANRLGVLKTFRVIAETDRVCWKGADGGSFSVKEDFRLLQPRVASSFPVKGIWVSYGPTKTVFFAWEATWGRF